MYAVHVAENNNLRMIHINKNILMIRNNWESRYRC